jgi:ParB family chromosome partitioning protein
MIAENEIRADLSPWEKGRIVVEARDQGLFDTLDEAVARLYPALDRNRRARIRAVAEVVEGLVDGTLERPESLNQHQLSRLANAIRAGLADLIQHALSQSSETSPAGQWRLLHPIMEEAEEEAHEASRPTADNRSPAPATNPAAPAASPAFAAVC